MKRNAKCLKSFRLRSVQPFKQQRHLATQQKFKMALLVRDDVFIAVKKVKKSLQVIQQSLHFSHVLSNHHLIIASAPFTVSCSFSFPLSLSLAKFRTLNFSIISDLRINWKKSSNMKIEKVYSTEKRKCSLIASSRRLLNHIYGLIAYPLTCEEEKRRSFLDI